MLTAAITIVVVTALAAIANGVIMITGGKELLKDALENGGYGRIADADLDLAAQVLGYDSAADVFATRGYVVLATGVGLLLFGLFMTKAATWARIMVTLASVSVMGSSVLVLGDETTPVMAGLAFAGILGAILSIIFTWLPANGRYAKALR
jgi:hypothetical protein